jgi:TolB-like protein
VVIQIQRVFIKVFPVQLTVLFPLLFSFFFLSTVGYAQSNHEDNSINVAVLPFASLGTSEKTISKVRSELSRALARKPGVVILPANSVDKAVARLCGKHVDWWECLGNNDNLFELGRRLKVKEVIFGQLASMGESLVLKLRVVDVYSNTVSTEIVNTKAGSEDIFSSVVLALHKRLFPDPTDSPAPESIPLYKRWETWTITGVGVAAIVVGSILLFGLDAQSGGQETNWDIRRTLP